MDWLGYLIGGVVAGGVAGFLAKSLIDSRDQAFIAAYGTGEGGRACKLRDELQQAGFTSWCHQDPTSGNYVTVLNSEKEAAYDYMFNSWFGS